VSEQARNETKGNLGFYLLNVFTNPRRAYLALATERMLWPLIAWFFLIGAGLYVVVVTLGYQALGWDAFPYKQYYPHYFDPYWWEVFVVPLWGLVLALGYAIPGYLLGRLFGGQGTFSQILAAVLLATIVSLPIFIIVDVLTILFEPEWIVRFATYGDNFIPLNEAPHKLLWLVETSYSYVAMTWQGVVTVVGLTVLHRIQWWKNVPAVLAGTGIFVLFLLLIRDYVALII
jgi:hypothetical protein